MNAKVLGVTLLIAGVAIVAILAGVSLKNSRSGHYIAFDGIYYSGKTDPGIGGLYIDYYCEVADGVEIDLVGEVAGKRVSINSGSRRNVGERHRTIQWVGDLMTDSGFFPSLPTSRDEHDRIALLRGGDRRPATSGSEIDIYRFPNGMGDEVRLYVRVLKVY